MRRSAALLAVAVIGVATILGIVVFLGNRADPVAEATTPGVPTSIESTVSATDIEPSRIDGASPAPQRESSATAVESGAKSPGGFLLVRVIAKKTGAPVPDMQIVACVQGQNASADRSHLPTTEQDGRVEIEVPSGVPLDVSAFAEGRDVEPVWRDVSALHPAERRDLVLEVRVDEDLRFFGRVLREDGSSPVPSARAIVALASYGQSADGSVPNLERTVLSSAIAGSDGVFNVSLASWKEPHIRVEAEGYALYVVRRVTDHDTPDRALLIRLTKAASLAARVVDAGGGAIVGATVVLTARGYNLPPRVSALIGGYVYVPDETWALPVGENGRCVLAGLVPGVEIHAEIRRDEELLFREPEPLVFQPGQTLEREWVLGRGCDVHGLVLDQDGKPVPNLGIWIAPRRPGGERYFYPYEISTTTGQTTTDEQGRFVLHAVPAGTWSLGPKPDDWSANEPTRSDAIAPVASDVEISSAPSQYVTLHVQRGRYIRGKVVDPDGNPAGNCFVLSARGGPGPQCRTARSGAFAFGPIGDGRHTLIGRAMERFADSDPVEAEAGAEGIVLMLKAGGAIRLHVLDARTGEPCPAEIFLQLDRLPGSFGSGFGSGTKPDGTLDWKGLEPGRYDISARTEDGKFGVASAIQVAAGAEPAVAEIRVSPGGTLKLRYEGKLPQASVGFLLDGIQTGWGVAVKAGEVVEQHAPAGAVTLEFRLARDREPKRRTVHLDPGEVEEVLIRDED